MPKSPLAQELRDVVVKLSFTRTITAIGEVVRTSARRLTGADGVTFVLRDGEQCYYVDEDAIAPLWKGRRFQMDACISGWVMRHGEAVSIPDIYEDPRIPHGVYQPTFVKSLLMVPVRREAPIAAIGAYWARVGKPSEREMAILQSLADASALAVANVELYTELQETIESERMARRAAEDASRLKDEFLATLSHELRTPLHIIQGWLWQLRQPNVSGAVQQHGLEVVERQAGLQARMVEDLLDASRAMSGTLRLDLEAVDLAAVCRAAVEDVAPEAQAKGVHVEALLGEAPVQMIGDPKRLQQVVSHLLANSIKFSRRGGTARLSLCPGPDAVRVEVADDGIGMPPSFVPHAFDPFRQADGGINRRYGGLGLGLAMVRHLTHLHGGSVRAVSDGNGHGTTVVLDLPLTGAVAMAENGEPALGRRRSLASPGFSAA